MDETPAKRPPGALVATAGIFPPSFVFVAILNPVIPRLRSSPWTAAFLGAVNVSAVALMAAVTVQLGASALRTWQAWAILSGAALGAVAFRVNPTFVIIGGAFAAYLLQML